MASSAGMGQAWHPPGSAPNNLPVLRSSIVGREAEFAAARALLLRDDVGLLTFTGPGGVGKTRLALHLASHLLERFPHGVFFVNLAPLSDPALVISTIAQTMGVQETPGHPLIAGLQDHLRDREMLLVLDNFEQVVEAASSVTGLLASCPRLKVLVTSREVLHLSAEHAFPVSPLACPTPQYRPPLEELTQYGAVRLFIQRALAVKPDFQVTHDNAPAVAGICLQVDGLPLAIELAAARVRLLTPEAILTRLDHRLRLLVGGARDLPARHQALRSTIEWSYDLLDDAEKRLFRRLAVFVGGCTLEAIEPVCNAEGDLEIDVLAAVSSLVDKSLLLRKKHGGGSEPRFVLLETIREYASEKLAESGEAEALRQRHGLCFMALAEAAEPQLRGPGQAVWLDRLEEEHDNLRAALTWAGSQASQVDDAGRLEIGLRLGGALRDFWDRRGHFTEGRAQLAPLLRRSASLGPTASRAKALIAAGRLAWDQGDLMDARSLYDQSLAIYRSLGDRLGMTYVLNGLANTVKLQGDYAAAAEFLARSLQVARELGDKYRIGAALENLGEIVLAQGDSNRARLLLEEGLGLFREQHDNFGIGLCLQDLGIALLREGDHHQAQRRFEEALALYRAIGEQRFSAVVLYELGQVARAQEDDSRAASLFMESLQAAHSLGDRIFVGLDLGGLAAIASGESKSARAAHLFGASDAIIDAAGRRWFQIDRETFERAKAAAYAELGAERWKAAVKEGRAMSLDEAVAYALEPGAQPVQPSPTGTTADPVTAAARASPGSARAAPGLEQLTPREVEVLRLVATGLTAAQVAERLSLSARTVENHLRSIYGKLNVSTRAAATRIAVEHGLLKD
jgi:predicted ATPase/DNA-binding CsgD family transcriptional regulator